jgi:hypothetical protein
MDRGVPETSLTIETKFISLNQFLLEDVSTHHKLHPDESVTFVLS